MVRPEPTPCGDNGEGQSRDCTKGSGTTLSVFLINQLVFMQCWPDFMKPEGDPGFGKSFLAMQPALQVSIGGELSDGQIAGRGRVQYLVAEDDAGAYFTAEL